MGWTDDVFNRPMYGEDRHAAFEQYFYGNRGSSEPLVYPPNMVPVVGRPSADAHQWMYPSPAERTPVPPRPKTRPSTIILSRLLNEADMRAFLDDLDERYGRGSAAYRKQMVASILRLAVEFARTWSVRLRR